MKNSIKNLISIEKPELEIAEGFVVKVNDNKVDSITVAEIGEDLANLFDNEAEVEENKVPTKDDLKEMKNKLEEADKLYNQMFEILIDETEDYNKLVALNLPLETKSVILNALMATARYEEYTGKELSEAEKEDRFQK